MRHTPIIPSLRPVREWTAEVTVGEALARRLIGEQFPQVEVDPLVLLGEGWDNTVWLAGGEWVFRFPRREFAIAGFERELATLPALAPRLPLPIPDPGWRGRPPPRGPPPCRCRPRIRSGAAAPRTSSAGRGSAHVRCPVSSRSVWA